VTGDEKLAVAEAYRAATAANDADALRALHEPDARTWHNFDGVSVSVDDGARSLAWLHRRVTDLQLDDVRLIPTAEGFLARWTLTGNAPGGPLRLHSCVVVELSPAGKVARAAEYLDSAQLAVLRPGSPRVGTRGDPPKRSGGGDLGRRAEAACTPSEPEISADAESRLETGDEVGP
jgi:ketosteroid isomerase-like protein